MQKNWYVVYTKPHYEKKVVSILTKRKIESFCPLNYKKITSFRRNKVLREPLFKSYVFVNITAMETAFVQEISGVTNMLHWKHDPAVIKEDEIKAIKEFISTYKNIEVDRVPVNPNEVVRFVDNTSYYTSGNIFAVKNKSLKVSLPSLGYILSAKIEDGSFFGMDTLYNPVHLGTYNKTRQQ